MSISLNDKRLLKIYFVLALNNLKPKRTPFFLFIKKGYFQKQKFLLLSQQTRPKDLLKYFLLCIYLHLRQNSRCNSQCNRFRPSQKHFFLKKNFLISSIVGKRRGQGLSPSFYIFFPCFLTITFN